MSEWTDEQYERVAAWLDGGAVELTGPERELAEQVASEERALAPAMAAPMDPGVPGRVMQRMQRDRSSRKFAHIRYACYGALAAAVVMLALLPGLLGRPGKTVLPSPSNAAAAPLDPREFEAVPEVRQMDQQLRETEKNVSAFREPETAPVSGEDVEPAGVPSRG